MLKSPNYLGRGCEEDNVSMGTQSKLRSMNIKGEIIEGFNGEEAVSATLVEQYHLRS